MAKSPKLLDGDGLWNYALRALGARAYAAGELRAKLERRAAQASDVAAVLARLKDYGYVDDRKFAESFSHARLENEGFGKARVLRDLRKRRVAPAVAEKAVKRAYGETDEMELAEAFLRRKIRGVALDAWLKDPKHLASAYRRLRLAGFSGHASLSVLKRLDAAPEMLESIESEEPGDETE